MIEQFHQASFFWDYLLNFDGQWITSTNSDVHVYKFIATLKNCADLSQLWYRESYLELTMGRKFQVRWLFDADQCTNEIRFSFQSKCPCDGYWLITFSNQPNNRWWSKFEFEWIDWNSHSKNRIRYVFYPMDLYNDAAMHALLVFRKQFLYDEIEAEVNLCFDQLVFKLSDKIFNHFKCVAAWWVVFFCSSRSPSSSSISMLLDKPYRSECHMNGIKVTFASANRFHILLKQRHVQVRSYIDERVVYSHSMTICFSYSVVRLIWHFY